MLLLYTFSRNSVAFFSFHRFPDQPTAADIINTLDVPSLAKIFKVYGEEKRSKKIAQAVFDARYMLKTINTTKELADLIKKTMGW